jgi:site-specific DNA-adenine methylase
LHYPGGKEHLVKDIEAQVLKYKTPQHTTYIEPFIGGGSVFCRLAHHFDKAIASDINEDLVMLWNGVLDGSFDPPEEVPEALYRELRHSTEHSALRAFAGIGSAFSGVWFGGYIAHGAGQSRRSLLRKIEDLRQASSVRIIHADYRGLSKLGPHVFVYADPPYAQAAFMYKRGARHFNSSEFWEYALKWAADGATVLVSEYQAPEHPMIKLIWQKEVKKTLAKHEEGAKRKKAAEILYLVRK